MGGKYSICARNLEDKSWTVCDYNLSFIRWIILGIRCFMKYDVVSMEKHG